MNTLTNLLSLEFIIIAAIIFVIYMLPHFKFTLSQRILRTPSYFRQGQLSLLATGLLIFNHAYLISSTPEHFLNCHTDECHVSLGQGLAFLIGYSQPDATFSEYGNYSRMIFAGISLLMLSITFHFYLRHLNERQLLKSQLKHLQRRCEVLLEHYENPAYDSKEEFSSLYIDYDLPKLGLINLSNAIKHYREDNSLHNFNAIVDQVKTIKNLGAS